MPVYCSGANADQVSQTPVVSALATSSHATTFHLRSITRYSATEVISTMPMLRVSAASTVTATTSPALRASRSSFIKSSSASSESRMYAGSEATFPPASISAGFTASIAMETSAKPLPNEGRSARYSTTRPAPASNTLSSTSAWK